jgi:ubiquinone/menaquinone biosynthesis C-methylase UbiE
MDINVFEYRKRILEKVFEFVQLKSQETVIDIGCGDGGDCELLLRDFQRVVGVDIKFNEKWANPKQGLVDFSVADASSLPFPDKSFSIVLEKDVLHHVKNIATASEEILRITKSGGIIVCIEGNRYNPILYFHMTLLKGHDHFTKAFFIHLMNSFSKQVKLLSVESRVYPTDNKIIWQLIHHFEDLLERIPLIRNYLCYNVAIIIKD